MARRIRSRQDVYIGDDLTWTGANVETNGTSLTVRARSTPGGAMVDVLHLENVTLAERRKRPREIMLVYVGEDGNGDEMTLTLIGKGCACGG